MIYCKICNKEFKNNQKSLCQHILKHNITSKIYYDTYLKKESEGVCGYSGCTKETKFQNINLGYQKFCCRNHTVSSESFKDVARKKFLLKSKQEKDRVNIIISEKVKTFWKSEEGTKLKLEYSSKRKNKKRPEVSRTIKEAFKNPIVLQKHKEGMNKPEVKQKHSLTMKEKWKNPHNREKYLSWRKNSKKVIDAIEKQKKYMLDGGASYIRSFNKSPSKPQIQLFNIVKTIFSTSLLEFQLLNYNLDIAIPQLKIAIEYDCSYWHNKKNDHIRQNNIEKLGWSVIRYTDIIPSKDQIIKDLNNFLFR